MKKKLILLLVLIFLFGGFIFIRYFILNQKAQSGKLKVFSSPSTSIFLNNTFVGKTPFEDEKEEGEYILKLIPEGTATDTASWQGKVRVYKNTLTYVDRELGSSDLTSSGVVFSVAKMEKKPENRDSGQIEIETEPAGAIVYLDNDEKGVSPLLIGNVLKGEHEISIFHPGFFRRTEKINVDPGYKVIGSFKLAIDPSQQQVEELGEEKEATESAQAKKTFVVVQDTPTGWLRVREGPSLSSSESAKVNPGDKFELLDEEAGWYKIEYEETKQGWVSSRYSEKAEE